jgi:uracil-DNA glycosylase
MFKEAMEDVSGFTKPSHGNLEAWSRQGVLLLNTVLTVRRGQANSHKGKGWETFTDAVIKELDVKKKGLVFVLWGKPAQVRL